MANAQGTTVPSDWNSSMRPGDMSTVTASLALGEELADQKHRLIFSTTEMDSIIKLQDDEATAQPNNISQNVRQCCDRTSSTSSTAESASGIDWPQVAKMIVTLVVGILCALGLHFYYDSKDGKLVGSGITQRNNLRIGNFLAWACQVALAYSVAIAFVQIMWRSLKGKIFTFTGLDAAFSATNTVLSLLDWEVISKIKLGYCLVVVCWLFPITGLFTPNTLNVALVLQHSTTMMNIPLLDISKAASYEFWSDEFPAELGKQRFAYAINETQVSTQEIYLGDRSSVGRITTATLSTAQVMPLLQPFTNASYVQSFAAPYIKCQQASGDVAVQIDGMVQRHRLSLDASIEEVSLDYLSELPFFGDAGIQVANLSDDPSNASNRLWIYYTSYEASLDFTKTVNPHYLMCQLYNASYTVNFTWMNGNQKLDILNLDVPLTPVAFPTKASTSAASEEQMAYAAIMDAFSSQLTGTIGFYKDLSTTTAVGQRIYSKIDSNIVQTILLGSTSFNSHFIESHLLNYNDTNMPFSDQRLEDMALAGNRPLELLIPELSQNVILSLISNPLMAPSVPTNVTKSYLANQYVYQSENVKIAYGIAIPFAVLANFIGLWAFHSNKVSYNLLFSTIVRTTHNFHSSSRLRVDERPGALSLDEMEAKSKLRFSRDEERKFGFRAWDEENQNGVEEEDDKEQDWRRCEVCTKGR